eukprot:tig00020553_g10556.t1
MELRPIKRQILWTTSVITVFTVAVIAPIVQTLARRGMLHSTLDEKPDSCLWSLSFLVSAVMVARLGMGLLFRLLLSHRIRRYCAHWFIVPAGFFFYAAAEAIQEASEARLALIVEIEPLLVAESLIARVPERN